MLVSDGLTFTDFQYNSINQIIENARVKFEDDAIRASLLPQSLNPLDSLLAGASATAGGPLTKWAEFDDTKIIGGVDDDLLGSVGI